MRKRQPTKSKDIKPKKIKTTLVERPRQKRWWRETEVIYPVPHYEPPTILGSRIAVSYEDVVYCLDSDFGFAKTWEFRVDPPPQALSAPVFLHTDKVAVTSHYIAGKYDAIIYSLNPPEIFYHRLSDNDKRLLDIFGPSPPVRPVPVSTGTVFINSYGNLTIIQDKRKVKVLNRIIRTRYQPVSTKRELIFHVDNGKSTWIEWVSTGTLKPIKSSRKYTAKAGIITGYIGTDPIVVGDNVVCGLGDRVVSFNRSGSEKWSFIFPQIESLKITKPVQLLGVNDDKTEELLAQSMNEVSITSEIHYANKHLYFVLSDCVSHRSYVVKLHADSGAIVWTHFIDGFSFGFSVVTASERGIILQNDTRLWFIAPDGESREDFKLIVDCVSCSKIVPLLGDRYVFLSDLGVHEVSLAIGTPAFHIMRGKQFDVFLSHASEDKIAIVRPFYDACQKNGVSAWLDLTEIRWGDSLIKKIEQGLSRAKYVILFMSKSFLSKPWPQKELETALSMEVNGQKAVLPIVLGLSHEELAQQHPIVASKLYKRIDAYDPSTPVSYESIEELVWSLKEVLRE